MKSVEGLRSTQAVNALHSGNCLMLGEKPGTMAGVA